jgi:hypothetical protein
MIDLKLVFGRCFQHDIFCPTETKKILNRMNQSASHRARDPRRKKAREIVFLAVQWDRISDLRPRLILARCSIVYRLQSTLSACKI